MTQTEGGVFVISPWTHRKWKYATMISQQRWCLPLCSGIRVGTSRPQWNCGWIGYSKTVRI